MEVRLNEKIETQNLTPVILQGKKIFPTGYSIDNYQAHYIAIEIIEELEEYMKNVI